MVHAQTSGAVRPDPPLTGTIFCLGIHGKAEHLSRIPPVRAGSWQVLDRLLTGLGVGLELERYVKSRTLHLHITQPRKMTGANRTST